MSKSIYAALAAFFLTVSVNAGIKHVDCSRHKIFCQIIDNHSSINREYAFELSNVIYKKAKKYKIDAEILTAILAQESMYDISAKNCTKGLVYAQQMNCVDEPYMTMGGVWTRERCEKHNSTLHEKKVCTDFGIGQIWYKTAKSFNFNVHKLTTDLDYSVTAAAMVLSDFHRRYKHKEIDWWTRYNASSRDARNRYKALVERYFNASEESKEETQ